MHYNPDIYDENENIDILTICGTFFEPNLDKLDKVTKENKEHDSLLTTCDFTHVVDLSQLKEPVIIQANDGSKQDLLQIEK